MTGASGFIGSHLVDALLASGHTVIAVDRRSPKTDSMAAINLKDAVKDPGFSFVQADIRTADISNHVAESDTVFHLAALPGVRSSWGSRFQEVLESNVLGTQRLLDACHRAGVPRMVFASSSSVYGAVAGANNETDSPKPASPYGITKLAAEMLCLAYAARSDAATSITSLRYFTVYGPRQRPDMAMSRMFASALTGRPFGMFGDGSQTRSFTYVSDVVRMTIAAAAMERCADVINVGSGTTSSISRVLELVGSIVGGGPITVKRLSTQPGDVHSTSADCRRSLDQFGTSPEVALEDGLRKQFGWLMSLSQKERSVAGVGVPA